MWTAQDYDFRPHVTDPGFWQVAFIQLLLYCCSTLTRSIGCWDKLLFHNHQPAELSHSLSNLRTSLTRKTEIVICLINTTPLMKNEDLKSLYALSPSLQACRWGPLSVPDMDIEFFFPVLENKLLSKMSLWEKTSWNRCIFLLNENNGHSDSPWLHLSRLPPKCHLLQKFFCSREQCCSAQR